MNSILKHIFNMIYYIYIYIYIIFAYTKINLSRKFIYFKTSISFIKSFVIIL